MRYFIGIDGGGTKTIAYLGNDMKEVISTAQVGATNYHSIGIDMVRERFKEIFTYFEKEENVAMDRIEGLCFGGAGIDSAEDERVVRQQFADIGYKNYLSVVNDSVIALVAANGFKRGGIVISGTGSIAYGIDQWGKGHRVGGWGHLIDDYGSGYAIARDALRRVLEGYDGRKAQSKIWDEVKSKLNLSHPEELIQFIYSPDTKKHHIAEIAPEIIKLYGIDEGATTIVEKAIDDLWEMTHSLAKRLNEDIFSLGLCGGLFENSKTIRRLFIEKVTEMLPGINVHLPYHKAVMGALILAVDSLDR
ncbi:N-acetylglucosamine kinase [Alkaliphilus peptidifermentans]|uniref:BadF-type ATPase n=1 Tax=Alkaliphilus peptidifermentans DSM 18978 TaxID=1120976 RepID=A0A1G5FAX6_9FIRM|nr:BadF/BadG/BcrA/BcrD ATPase family protein [Alkaliphilus peptidifermentans]SCY36422.1 BadF-type ATPase [Alkaliphilus peptidifermentans DSM 18978]